jgi:hypothetical protein
VKVSPGLKDNKNHLASDRDRWYFFEDLGEQKIAEF